VWNIPFNGLGVASASGYQALMTNVSATLASDDSGFDPSCVGSPQKKVEGSSFAKVSSRTGSESSPLNQCLATDALLSDSGWTTLVRELMLEVIAVARALEFKILDSLADQQIERTRSMG